MSSITIRSRKKNIAPSESADARLAHHACCASRIGKCGRNFGWRSDATHKPSQRSSHRCREEHGELDVKLSAHPLPDRERFSQQRWARRGVMSVHANLSTLRQRGSAGLRRAWRRPASGGNAAGDRRSHPQTGARRVSAQALRHTPTPLRAGCRLLGEPREPTDGLKKGPQAVVLLQTSRARRVVLLSTRCYQYALLWKTEEVRCTTRDVTRRFESSRSVPNVPATGKEGTDD